MGLEPIWQIIDPELWVNNQLARLLILKYEFGPSVEFWSWEIGGLRLLILRYQLGLVGQIIDPEALEMVKFSIKGG